MQQRTLVSLLVAPIAAAAAAACAPRQPSSPAAPSRVDTLLLVQPPTFQVSAPAPAGAGGVTAADSSPRVMLASESPFYPLARSEWPGPNQYRSASGAPGPAYWQQRADYAIDATLDTAEQRLRGSVTIRYTNNSPDTLRFVWLNIDQNVYKPGSRGSGLFAAEARASGAGFAGGYDEIADVRVDGRPARFVVSDTRMRVELERPLPPGGARATISVGRWSFRVPVKGSDRMGRDGALYAIAQWYPRVAVYDDVRGWNTEPYLGQGEFYTEFGDFDLAITVPAGYVVASTGVLRNPREVLTAAQRERLARAAKSEQTVQVIADSEARVSVARPTPGTKTWRYRAERVRDVAWAAAPDFRWDASSWKGVMLHAFYEEEKTKGAWAKAVEHSRWTIGFYSEHFAPYPYPQATSIATTIGGMEYPMLVFNPYGTPGDPESIFGVNDHELAHQWAPMVVGSNERRYEFMDEGFNSYMNLFSNEARGTGQRGYPGMVANWKLSVDSGFQTPVLFRTDHFHERGRGPMGYRKPAIALVLLRNHVIGRELFDSAFREYLRRWSFRHPTPGDFFRTVENVAGEDLSWFWRGFLYSTDVLDVGIAGITTEERNGRTVALVTLTRTTIPFPVSLRLALADGSLQEVRLPVDIWARGQRHTAIIDVRSPVVGARLWPDPTVPDWNQANDVWGRAPAQDEMGPVTSDGTTPLPTKATP